MQLSNKIEKKYIGQTFTPAYIVEMMLDCLGYNSESILKKHIIDNSCGKGAFLLSIVKRYIKESIAFGLTNDQIKSEIELYIHGIEIDIKAYKACRANLDRLAAEYGLYNIQWSLFNKSSLAMDQFNKKMDFVIGNPPYVRVHNLFDTYCDVKKYNFASEGMTDLYLVFFELGFNMLNSTGKLCYITPSSWLTSIAARKMRLYIIKQKNLVELTDLGHFQPFEHVIAYTIISLFDNSKYCSNIDYYNFNSIKHKKDFVANLLIDDCIINNSLFLAPPKDLDFIRLIKETKHHKYVSVKNGFATLADNVFIGDNIPDSKITIRVLKASTGKWHKCLFPYDENGKLLQKDVVFAEPQVAEYFNAHKDKLLKGKKSSIDWYQFGRTQALKDVFRQKLAVNNLLRDENDLKINLVKNGEGIYSGLYVITDYDISLSVIKNILNDCGFSNYIRSLKKYKSGGYFTFNSKDIEQYLNWYLTFKSNRKYAYKSTFFGQDIEFV